MNQQIQYDIKKTSTAISSLCFGDAGLFDLLEIDDEDDETETCVSTEGDEIDTQPDMAAVKNEPLIGDKPISINGAVAA